MIRKPHPNGGMYFSLEESDWKGDLTSFFAAVNTLPTSICAPFKLDEPGAFWFIGKDSITGMNSAYEKHIAKIIRQLQADED